MNQTNLHNPVLLEESLELMNIESGKKLAIDATLGLGGHTEAMLERNEELSVIGIDRDSEALSKSQQRLAPFGERFIPFKGTYDQVPEAMAAANVSKVDAILGDLGVSSMQLDFPERGFSYSQDAPLDMRMDPTQGITATELIEESSVSELAYIIKTYGEEKFARLIAKHIAGKHFASSHELNDVISAVVPKPHKGHPAKRTYQALRIAVNNEIEILENFVPEAIQALNPAGRLVVISYHSLEDNVVKKAMQKASNSSAPVGLPVELEEHKPILKMLTRGVVRASEAELEVNPRSASGRLRAAEKLGAK